MFFSGLPLQSIASGPSGWSVSLPRPGSNSPRNPLDPTGFMAWLRRARTGRFFRATRERAFALSHRAFVTSAFRSLLDRDPDDAGLRHFGHDLARGRTTREQVLGHIGQSGEGAASVLLGPGLREHVAEVTALRAAVPDGTRPLCFLHPMKCGGTALTIGLSRLADPWPKLLDVWVDQLVCMPQPVLANAMLVTGHLPYSALTLLPAETAVCTVVREPVARTLSHFAHVRTHGRQMGLSLDEFVTSDRWRSAWVNYQARQLALDVPVEEAWQGRLAGTGGLQDMLDAAPDIDDDELTERALTRLRKIDVVGVADDLDAIAAGVAETWGKAAPSPLPRSNESLVTVSAADVTARVRALIEQGTVADAVLYREAGTRSRL
jgi:hypothetical protein